MYYSKNRFALIPFLFVLSFIILISNCSKKEIKVIYGISPYQDTVLPVVAEKQGWYLEEGLNVELKLLDWSHIMNAVSEGEVSVAIQNFNLFQPGHINISEEIIFYYPLFIFKGCALIVRDNTGYKTFAENMELSPGEREKAIAETVKQLKGKHIITTTGTEMEHVVLSALEKAGLDKEKDVKITNASPAEGLKAFLAGEADIYSGDLAARIEAAKHGAVAIIESSELPAPVIDGLVTTKKFARENPDVLLKLIKIWFKTINWMNEDFENRCKIVIDHLGSISDIKYSVEDYKYTWEFINVFPVSAAETEDLILLPESLYFWKRSWDANNELFIKQKTIAAPVPYEAFTGETAHKKLK